MDVIPVIDLMNGCVVRGIAGRRESYRPIVSTLCNSADPLAIADALQQSFGGRQLYLADLDAIRGAAPCVARYEALVRRGYELWVDAGLRTAHQAVELVKQVELNGVVVGLETVESLDQLRQMQSQLDPRSLVFSLDLQQGTPRAAASCWHGASTMQIVRDVLAQGISRLIVLDLAAVGTAAGPANLELCKVLRHEFPKVQLVTGGGVRHVDDLRQLAEAGCDAALVASALHDGRIMREDLYQLQQLGPTQR